jgi:citrate synthase
MLIHLYPYVKIDHMTTTTTTPNTTTPLAPLPVPPGLKGVAVTDTEIGDVRGLEGFYHYRQYSAIELARQRSLEDVWQLLLDGYLPAEVAARDRFAAEIRPGRDIPGPLLDLLAALVSASPGAGPMTGLRTALSALGAYDGMQALWDLDPTERRRDLIRLAAATPTLVAALHRLGEGLDPVQPDPDLGHAANYLWMVTGSRPEPALARALEQYLILTVDHGFNSSTFTARVIASTGADAAAAVVGALGALSGPLHGGAPSRALDTIDAIGTPDRAEPYIRNAVTRGERIMGFGHAVYRTEDPRSRLLREVAGSLGGDLVNVATDIERIVLRVLAELKPGNSLYTNVEFYAGVVMDRCGLPRQLFTPTFAVSRVIGWCANIAEQAAARQIIRPAARYVGPPPPAPVPALP